MKLTGKRRLLNMAAFFAGIVLLSGCASLTQSQVDEVNKFAKITEGYNELPPKVYRSYAEIYLIEKSMTAATGKIDNTMEKVTGAIENYQKILDKMQEVESSLSVLKSYAKLLQRLSSDEFSDNLSKEAALLGEEIDGGIKLLNEKNNELHLDSFGSIAAAIVKGAGGIYIKHKQAKALKKCVIGAEPNIKKITLSIETLCSGMDSLTQKKKDDIKVSYRALVVKGKFKNTPKDVDALIKLLVRADNIKKAATACINAAGKYRVAHTKLFKMVQKRKTLQTKIKEIMDMYVEIKKIQTLIEKSE
jgi:hypothetical protein